MNSDFVLRISIESFEQLYMEKYVHCSKEKDSSSARSRQ